MVESDMSTWMPMVDLVYEIQNLRPRRLAALV